jgi:outer membrane murein-binding lipoprotein Lpp
MGRLLLICGTVLVLTLLAGCTSQGKIDDAVTEATKQQTIRIAELEKNLSAQTTAAQQARAQLAEFNTTLQSMDDSLNECTTKATSCWAERSALEAQSSNQSKKIVVLQGWVDICQKTLNGMG